MLCMMNSPLFGKQGAAAPATDPYWSNVVLLVGGNGPDASTTFTDESPSAHAMTAVGSAQVDTAQSKFGGGSLLLDGTGDFLSTPDSPDWDFGSGPFTVEAFVQLSVVDTEWTLASQWSSTSTNGAWALFSTGAVPNNHTYFRFYDSTGVIRDTVALTTPVANTWYHIVADRDAAGKVRLYIDGTMIASQTYTQAIQPSTNGLRIGSTQDFPTLDFPGWFDEVRITKGVARYASDAGFVVPTAAFPRFGPPGFTSSPSIAGNPWVGQTLTCNPGTDTGTSRTYQWNQDATPISGATSSTYVPVSGDATHSITCTVTATNAYGSVSATSAGVYVFAADPAAAIRGSRLLYVNNASSGTLTLPSGSAAGDLMVLYAGHGWGVNTPSGWTSQNNMAGSFFNGAVLTKVLTSGDITTGSVTVTFTSTYYGILIGVTFVGGTSGVRTVAATRDSSGAASRTVTTGGTPVAGDYVLYFGGARVNAAATSSSGTTALQSNVQNEASSVARFGTAGASGATSGVFNYAGSPSGDYQAVVVIAP